MMELTDLMREFSKQGYLVDIVQHEDKNTPTTRIRKEGKYTECSVIVFIVPLREGWDVSGRTPGMFFQAGFVSTIPEVYSLVADLMAEYSQEAIDSVKSNFLSAGYIVDIDEFECLPRIIVYRSNEIDSPLSQNTTHIIVIGSVFVSRTFNRAVKGRIRFVARTPSELIDRVHSSLN